MLLEYYTVIVALHIIFIVTWFAGLFYIVRLFIYHTEAFLKQEPDQSILSKQFEIMERRLMQLITTPSMFLVLITGFMLLYLNPKFFYESWMQLKLFFIFILIIYHLLCFRILIKLKYKKSKASSMQLRLLNEVATICLISIVFLIELKSLIEWFSAIAIFIGILICLLGAIFLYKKHRKRSMHE